MQLGYLLVLLRYFPQMILEMDRVHSKIADSKGRILILYVG